MEQAPGSFRGRICDVEQVPGSFRGRICDVEQAPGSLQGRICDVEQVPGSLRGRICDVEQAPGSLRGTICDVEQVPWAVAGATDVAVAGPVTLQGPLPGPRVVAEAGPGDVTRHRDLRGRPRPPGPKHYYRLASTCQLN